MGSKRRKRRARVAHLPAGVYWVGDPCYPLSGEGWDEYLSPSAAVDGMTVALSDGRLVAAHGTAGGDGCYPGSDGRFYLVDSGMLGVVTYLPGDPIDPEAPPTVFPEPFTVSYDDGDVIIGHITIET